MGTDGEVDPATLTFSTSSADQSPFSRPQSSSGSTPIGSIVGAILGGIAGLAMAVLLAWLYLRRRRQNEIPKVQGEAKVVSATELGEALYQLAERDSRMPKAELAAPQTFSELEGTRTADLEAMSPAELEATSLVFGDGSR